MTGAPLRKLPVSPGGSPPVGTTNQALGAQGSGGQLCVHPSMAAEAHAWSAAGLSNLLIAGELTRRGIAVPLPFQTAPLIEGWVAAEVANMLAAQ